MTLHDHLTDLRLSSDLVHWAAGKSLEQAWDQCPKPEWLIEWAQAADNNSRRDLVRAACITAEHAMISCESPHLYRAVRTATEWIEGNWKLTDLLEVEKEIDADLCQGSPREQFANWAAWSLVRAVISAVDWMSTMEDLSLFSAAYNASKAAGDMAGVCDEIRGVLLPPSL